jgi:hypothetical protein
MNAEKPESRKRPDSDVGAHTNLLHTLNLISTSDSKTEDLVHTTRILGLNYRYIIDADGVSGSSSTRNIDRFLARTSFTELIDYQAISKVLCLTPALPLPLSCSFENSSSSYRPRLPMHVVVENCSEQQQYLSKLIGEIKSIFRFIC